MLHQSGSAASELNIYEPHWNLLEQEEPMRTVGFVQFCYHCLKMETDVHMLNSEDF